MKVAHIRAYKSYAFLLGLFIIVWALSFLPGLAFSLMLGFLIFAQTVILAQAFSFLGFLILPLLTHSSLVLLTLARAL